MSSTSNSALCSIPVILMLEYWQNPRSLCRDTNVYVPAGMHVRSLIAGMDQLGKVASPVRGQLNRESVCFLILVRSRLRIWSRWTGSAVSCHVSPLILHTESDMVLRLFFG